MSQPSIVRAATPNDEEQIMALCRELHRENGLFKLDEEKVNQFVWRALNPHKLDEADLGPRGVIGVIGEEGNLEGFIFMLISQFWYSSEYHLEELLNFVKGDCRSSMHARNLITYAKACSLSVSLPLLIGVISNIRTQAKVRLYERQLRNVGSFFLFDGKDVTSMKLPNRAA